MKASHLERIKKPIHYFLLINNENIKCIYPEFHRHSKARIKSHSFTFMQGKQILPLKKKGEEIG